MHIGLYFGSFNPIHTGHLIIANHMLQYSPLDRLWFVVSPHNPLKESASLLNEYDRYHLVQLAIEGSDKMRASNVEFSLPKPSYTIDTLAYLSEKHPHDTFSIIMGSDSIQNIRKWKNYETLLAHYPIWVYKRPGHEVPTDLPKSNITVVEAPLLDISATFIRGELKKRHSVRYLVPDKVWQYLEGSNYYRQ